MATQNLFDNDNSGSTAELDANFTQTFDRINKISTVSDTLTAGTYAFHIDSSLRVLFGDQTARSAGGVTPSVQNNATSINNSSYLSSIWASGSASGPLFLFAKSRSGTVGSHASGAVSSADILGGVDGYGSDGSDFYAAVQVRWRADSAASAGIVPGRFVVSTANASGTMSEALRVDSNQAVLLSSPTGGLGYRTGAGGTVTQATSKSTGVTLNNVCGNITMNNAALASATAVTFTLTNSAIATGDLLVINHVSGGTAGAYTFTPQCGAGSASITVRNVSGGSLSEAIVIKFAVIKGVTA